MKMINIVPLIAAHIVLCGRSTVFDPLVSLTPSFPLLTRFRGSEKRLLRVGVCFEGAGDVGKH